MEKKDFIIILVVIIAISGGYYLYSNNLWPFSGGADVDITKSISEVYAISGVAKEVYDTVVVIQTESSPEGGSLGELMAVIDNNTSIFRYHFSDVEAVERVNLSVRDIKVGDRLALTSDEDISKKQNGVFLASSIAVYR